MKITPVAALRSAVLLGGSLAGVLLVRALDEGLSREPRALSAGHIVLGLLLAAVAMPGPVLGAFLTDRSSEKARGLGVGGTAVTALAALLGGVILWRRVAGEEATRPVEWLALAWCALALPLALVDFLRLREGAAGKDPAP